MRWRRSALAALLATCATIAQAGTLDDLVRDAEADARLRSCVATFLSDLGVAKHAARGSHDEPDPHRALTSPATRLVFSRTFGDAARRATEKLAANRDYRFSGLQFGWIKLPGDAWERRDRFGRWFEPRVSNVSAVAQFTDGEARSDCGVGRQVAQYATLAELFGPSFDRAFTRDEIVIGTFNKLQRSNSVLLGKHRGELEADGLAKKTSKLGAAAFGGLPGVLYAVNTEALTDTSNQAQNFVVHSVTAEAADALRRRDGFRHYNVVMRELWRSAQAIGFHVVRMLDRNFGTPYRIELALHNVHGEIFARYADTKIRECAALR